MFCFVDRQAKLCKLVDGAIAAKASCPVSCYYINLRYTYNLDKKYASSSSQGHWISNDLIANTDVFDINRNGKYDLYYLFHKKGV